MEFISQQNPLCECITVNKEAVLSCSMYNCCSEATLPCESLNKRFEAAS